MRIKEFMIRLGVILPMAVWSVFLFLMILGIVFYQLGADSAFYCTTYCQVGIALNIIVISGVIIYQARACVNK